MFKASSFSTPTRTPNSAIKRKKEMMSPSRLSFASVPRSGSAMAHRHESFDHELFESYISLPSPELRFILERRIPSEMQGYETELAKYREVKTTLETETMEVTKEREACVLKLAMLDAKLEDIKERQVYYDCQMEEAEKGKAIAEVTSKVTDYALWHSHDKPFAVWTVPRIRQYLELTTPSQVKSLDRRQSVGVLHKMKNMGFEGNTACPDDGIKTKNVPVSELHQQIIMLLQLDNVPSEDIDYEHEEALLLEKLEEIRELRSKTPRPHQSTKRARFK